MALLSAGLEIITPSRRRYGPNLIRNIAISSTEIVTYDTTKHAILKRGYEDGLLVHLASAITAGFAATCVGSPAGQQLCFWMLRQFLARYPVCECRRLRNSPYTTFLLVTLRVCHADVVGTRLMTLTNRCDFCNMAFLQKLASLLQSCVSHDVDAKHDRAWIRAVPAWRNFAWTSGGTKARALSTRSDWSRTAIMSSSLIGVSIQFGLPDPHVQTNWSVPHV